MVWDATAVEDGGVSDAGNISADESMVRTLSIYAGMLTETLLEYEEPDTVMEQVFHRISDLLEAAWLYQFG